VQHSERNSYLAGLKSLSDALEKISHDLRTPLGVSSIVLRDAAQGHDLGIIDYSNAADANQKILNMLNELRSLVPLKQEQEKSIFCLNQLLGEAARSIQHRSLNVALVSNDLVQVSNVRGLIDHAMQCMFYALSKTFEAPRMKTRLELRAEQERHCIIVSVFSEQNIGFPIDENIENFFELAKKEKRSFSVAYSMIELICRSLGGQTSFERGSDNSVVMKLFFHA
jgi:signal transduction histidine kinase